MLTINSRSSRMGGSSFFWILLCCNWHHFLTKNDLPQNLQKFWLIDAGCEPSCYINQDVPVWGLQNLYMKKLDQIMSGLFFWTESFRVAQLSQRCTEFQTVKKRKTSLRTYLKGRRTAIATAMSASVTLSPTRKVLGSSAWSRTFRTLIISTLEFCWIWENQKIKSDTYKTKAYTTVESEKILHLLVQSSHSHEWKYHSTGHWGKFIVCKTEPLPHLTLLFCISTCLLALQSQVPGHGTGPTQDRVSVSCSEQKGWSGTGIQGGGRILGEDPWARWATILCSNKSQKAPEVIQVRGHI